MGVTTNSISHHIPLQYSVWHMTDLLLHFGLCKIVGKLLCLWSSETLFHSY